MSAGQSAVTKRTPRRWLALMVFGGALGGLGLIGAVVAPVVAVVITTQRIGDIQAPPPEKSPGSMMLRWTLPGLLIAAVGAVVFLCAFLVLRRSGAAPPDDTEEVWNKGRGAQ